MQFVTEAKELAEVHDQWIPFLGVNIVLLTRNQDVFLDMDTHNTHFDRLYPKILISEWVYPFDQCLYLNGTLRNSRRSHQVRRHCGQQSCCKLLGLVAIPSSHLVFSEHATSGQQCQSINSIDQIR